MKTTRQELRTVRKKARAWLAILTYNCALGKNQLSALNQRLLSLCEPVFKPRILGGIIRKAALKSLDEKEAADVKKRIMSKLTPNKIERRMLKFPKIPSETNPVEVKPHSLTLGKLIVAWTALTHQSTEDFLVEIYPSINRLYKNWCDMTGCRGLSDEECHSHPRETARFWSGFLRIMIQKTPEENLINFVQSGIQALGTVVRMPSLAKKYYDLLGQATRVVTEETTKRIESALKENPYARERINVPELQVLVLREEEKLGWRKNTEEQAVRILRENLNPEVKEVVENKDDVIIGSMEAVSRRGLLNNLEAALKGQLKPRFIESIWRLLQGVSRIVTSTWEFDTSNVTKEGSGSIRRWLFRR